MTLRTYQADSMAEALAAVRCDLGERATLLNTRTFKRGGFLGLGRRTIVEVTALPADVYLPEEAKPSRELHELKTQRARHAYSLSASSIAAGDVSHRAVNPGRARVWERDAHREFVGQRAVDNALRRVDALSPAPSVLSPKGQRICPPGPAIARRFILTSPVDNRAVFLDADTNPPSMPSTMVNRSMQEELAAIKSMVGEVLQHEIVGRNRLNPLMPQQLFEVYLRLISQDLSEELANRIVEQVRHELSDVELEDGCSVRAAVLRHLAGFIPVADHAFPACRPCGRPWTMALIGPTGVGKTTTLAKLAAAFKLRQHWEVGLITADTYRIAAVDQLRTYADIIDVPLEVAESPDDMPHAMAGLSNCDVVLIDTAGRSQNDTTRLRELKAFLTAADPHEVHLVLSGTAGEKVLLREAEAFSELGVHKIVLTKLDESVNFGMLVNAVHEIGKQVSFITTGQEVPDHLEVGRADRLAQLVMGETKLP